MNLYADRHIGILIFVENKEEKFLDSKILYSLKENTCPILVKSSKELWKKIKNTLNDLKEGKDISFDELLKELNVLEHQYILAIRSSLTA